MATLVIDWVINSDGIRNIDGSQSAFLQGGEVVTGPGNIALDYFPNAYRFGNGATCSGFLSPAAVDSTRFAVQVVFRVTEPVTTRGNLVESTSLPFAIYVQPGSSAEHFTVEATVHNGQVGWTGVHTAYRRTLAVNQWCVVNLVYDLDTLTLLIDRMAAAITAFPSGGLRAPVGDQLQVGSWLDGRRWPLNGEIAGVKVWNGIPEVFEEELDRERGSAEWFLTYKENDVRNRLNLGPKLADFYLDPSTGSYIQPYALAVISYNESHGAAFVMQGAILTKWRSDENLRRALGGLVSDELPGRRVGSRKSVFANGCIYWSSATGAYALLNRFYIDYELLGEDSNVLGLPIADQEIIAGGKVQRFQHGKIYFRDGNLRAFEVHGAILEKFERAGGTSRFGFPISHETDVLREGRSIGKKSDFQHCTIYWSPTTPACFLLGAIREKYRGSTTVPGEGGPSGHLGFPTSDESDIPGVSAGRYNTFQNGSILWFSGDLFVCRPFQIALGRLDTKEEDRDFLDTDGQNDLYCRVAIDENGGRVFDRKYPDNAIHFRENNIVDLNLTVPHTSIPNRANLTVKVRVEVWESDNGNLFSSGDDHLGTMTKELNIANAWGLREGSQGLFRARNFGPWINYLDWSVKPQVTSSTPFDTWGVHNDGTPIITRREYAAAFSDVDPDFELDFGLIDDGLKELFYKAVVEGVASGGNCFGMALENIYAWKEQSRLGRPLSRFTNWANVEDDFNVKHLYQVGSDAIWWFLGQFMSGGSHDPKSVFEATWDAYERGEHPVLCVTQNADFSGAPHCILPISWNRSVTPWEIGIFDSNDPNQVRKLTIDPVANKFYYDGGNIYSGSAWSGGRLYYYPWSVLNHRQRTPVWDAMMLLTGGVVFIMGDTAQVDAITDEKGNSIEAASVRSKSHLKGKLLKVPGLYGSSAIKGSFYVGKQEPNRFWNSRLVKEAIDRIATTPFIVNPAPISGTLRKHLPIPPVVKFPVPISVSSDSIAGATLADLYRKEGPRLFRPDQPTDLDTINCSFTGKSNGSLECYYKRALLGIHIQGSIGLREKANVLYSKMQSRENAIRIQAERQKPYDIRLTHKLGAGKDFMKIDIHGLASVGNQPVEFNVQPGSRVVNVMSNNEPTEVNIIVSGVVDGKKKEATFRTRIEGMQRFVLPNVVDAGMLKIQDIDNLFGSGCNQRIIKKQ